MKLEGNILFINQYQIDVNWFISFVYYEIFSFLYFYYLILVIPV